MSKEIKAFAWSSSLTYVELLQLSLLPDYSFSPSTKFSAYFSKTTLPLPSASLSLFLRLFKFHIHIICIIYALLFSNIPRYIGISSVSGASWQRTSLHDAGGQKYAATPAATRALFVRYWTTSDRRRPCAILCSADTATITDVGGIVWCCLQF